MLKTIAIIGIVGAVGYVAFTQIVPRLSTPSQAKPEGTNKPTAAQQVDSWITATRNAFSLGQEVYNAVNGDSSKPTPVSAGGLAGLL
jgi:hypothetical protein